MPVLCRFVIAKGSVGEDDEEEAEGEGKGQFGLRN